VEILKGWIHAAGIVDGCLFRSVISGRVGLSTLHPYAVNRVIKAAALDAGLDPAIVGKLSGHSMRVGAAQDLMADGVGFIAIMEAGGWKSMSVVARYVEHVDIALCGEMRRQT
jgi:integrase/recombinase XerD